MKQPLSGIMLVLFIGALLLPGSSLSLAQEVNCTSPSIGSNIQTRLSNPENGQYFGQFYLNIAEPARCNGTIMSVDYCYYGPNQYGDIRVWAAAVALYHSEGADSYRRVSDGILLSKSAPSDPISPNPEIDLLLNFNCDTYVLNSTIRVQEGDIFGTLVIADITLGPLLHLGGLDLVGDSSDGYLMMSKSLNEIRDLVIQLSRNSSDVDLPQTLDGLSLDNEKRVLHVYASIKPHPSDIAPIKTTFPYPTNSPETTNVPDQTVTKYETSDNVIPSNDHEISTQPPISIEDSLPSQIITIGSVLGVIVIVGILISIVTVMVIIYKMGQKASFDLTTNEAYSERNIHQVHHTDESDDTYEEIQDGTTDVSSVPLEQNAAYIVTSSISASRNVAYENASEYEYINND